MAGPQSPQPQSVQTSDAPSADAPWSDGESQAPVRGVDEIEDLDVDRFARLESLVRALVAGFDGLRHELDGRERRVRELEEELRQANQMRQDVGKRIDDLIVQLEGIAGEEASG